MVTVSESPIGIAPPKRRTLAGFFIGMALLALGIVLLAFVPEYRQFSKGAFPIARVLHVHAVIMVAWVLSFLMQAYLGARHQLARHQELGRFVVYLAWLAWASMLFVECRVLIVGTLPKEPAAYDWMLPGPYVYLTFPIFLAWGYHEQRRPEWHKRLMTFALFLSLQAAIQRFLWIPMTSGYWPFAGVLDVCLLIPLIAYDLHTRKGRLHPASVRGILLLGLSQAVLLSLWGTETWRNFAWRLAHTLHAA
jgi:hypothetical protein